MYCIAIKVYKRQWRTALSKVKLGPSFMNSVKTLHDSSWEPVYYKALSGKNTLITNVIKESKCCWDKFFK